MSSSTMNQSGGGERRIRYRCVSDAGTFVCWNDDAPISISPKLSQIRVNTFHDGVSEYYGDVIRKHHSSLRILTGVLCLTSRLSGSVDGESRVAIDGNVATPYMDGT